MPMHREARGFGWLAVAMATSSIASAALAQSRPNPPDAGPTRPPARQVIDLSPQPDAGSGPHTAPSEAELQKLIDKGQRALMSRRLSEARDHFLSCVSRAPAFARCHLHLGSTYARLGLAAEAAAHYQIFLKLTPDADEAPRVSALVEQYLESLDAEEE